MPMQRMDLPSHHDFKKFGEWKWFSNQDTMRLTLWLMYHWMEASMQDAMEKWFSLTYMPVREWYLPWWVSGHGTEITSRRRSPKYPEKTTQSQHSKPTGQKIHETKINFWKNILQFQGYIMTFGLTVFSFLLGAKSFGAKRSKLSSEQLDRSNRPKVIR